MKLKEYFNIYKVDNDYLLKELGKEGENLSTINLVKELVGWIDSKLGNVARKEYKEYKGFHCIYIQKNNKPNWGPFVEELMKLEAPILNYSNSYILIKFINDNIYVIPGGYGAKLVESIVDKSFGISIIPKLVDDDKNIIKSMSKDCTSGKNIEYTTKLKNASNFIDEKDYNGIPKNSGIYFDDDMLTNLGINVGSDEKLNGTCGVSLSLSKSFTIDELEALLINLERVEKERDRFNMTPFIKATKIHIRESHLDNILFEEYIQNHNVIGIRADISENEFIKWNKTRVNFENDYYDIEALDTDHLYALLLKINGKLSKSFVSKFFKKAKIILLDDRNGYISIKDINDLVQSVIEYDEKTFLKINGGWLAYRESGYEYIDEQYRKNYDINYTSLKNTDVINNYNIIKKQVKNKNGILIDEYSENDYNASFEDNKSVIISHRKCFKNVELSDLIFWDEENVYLMCNKSKMENIGVRDLESQMETAIRCLRNLMDGSIKWKEEYYKKLDASQQSKISLKDFKALFNKKVVFIAGFKCNFKKSTKSVYCKNLLSELIRIAKQHDFGCLIMNYSEETK